MKSAKTAKGCRCGSNGGREHPDCPIPRHAEAAHRQRGLFADGPVTGATAGLAIVPTETHAAALDYAAQGWPVFPCDERKRPVVKQGFKAATTDREQVNEWWYSKPWANVATPTGSSGCGCNVVDVDAGDALGPTSERYGSEDGPQVHTPRGGIHRYMKSNGERFKSGQNDLAQGVDTRGTGGYVLLPPSRTEAGVYKWVGRDLPLPPTPAAMFAALERKSKPAPPAQVLQHSSALNVDRFVSDYLSGYDLDGPEAWQGGRRWRLGVCPWAGNHTDQADTRGAFVVELPSGALSAGCHHASCSWEWSDLRERFEGPRLNRSTTTATTAPVVEATSSTEDPPRILAWERLSFAECATGEIVEPPHLIRGLVYEDEAAVLNAPPKSLKTATMMQTTIDGCLGRPVLGLLDVARPLRILWVDEEMGRGSLHRIFNRLAKGSGLTEDEIRQVDENLDIRPQQGLDLSDPAHSRALMLAAEQHRADLIVLDSLIALQTGSENTAEDRRRFYREHLIPLKRSLGCSILMSTHPPLASKEAHGDAHKRARGSGDITAQVDRSFYMADKTEEHDPDGILTRSTATLSTYVAREGTPLRPMFVTLEGRQDEPWAVSGAWADSPEAKAIYGRGVTCQIDLLDYLRQNDGEAYQPELKRHLEQKGHSGNAYKEALAFRSHDWTIRDEGPRKGSGLTGNWLRLIEREGGD